MAHAVISPDVRTAPSALIRSLPARPPWQERRRAAPERARRAAHEREKSARERASRPVPARRPKRRFDVPEMTARLVALRACITEGELASGLTWYDGALDAARQLAPLLSAPDALERAVAVIAHLSPRTRWANNVGWAATLILAASKGDECPRVAVRRQRNKAWAVATGEASPERGHGPKTGAFYRSILGDRDAVCVDAWALRAALGDPEAGRGGVDERAHAKVAEAYARAARIIGMAPRDFQAAVWIHVRGSAD